MAMLEERRDPRALLAYAGQRIYSAPPAAAIGLQPHASLNMDSPSRERFQKEAVPYLNEIYASALRLARNPEKAEDLVSEVYSRAWKSFGQFTPGTNMRAWLYKILTNTFITHSRQKQREPIRIDLDQTDDDPERGSGGSLY